MKKTTALWCGTAAALCVLLIGCRSQNISDSAATRHAGNADSSPADASSQAANSDTQEAASAENSTEAAESSSQEAASVSARVQQMTLEEKVCQKFIVTPESLTGFNGTVVAAGDTTRAALETYPVGGLIYFSANLETQEQTREMLTNTQNYAQELSGIGVFLAVDEEGGTVARAADSLGTTAFSDMSVYGADADTEKANEIGSTIGNDLKALGFNLDFAPVADVNLNSKNELGNRIFSSDPAVVASMSAGVVTGLQNSGVCATLKHFPGLGAGDGNTHRGSVYIERTLEELEQLANGEEVFEKMVVTMKKLSEDEKIRMQCEAREDYERCLLSEFNAGKREGRAEGERKRDQDLISSWIKKGKTIAEIAEYLEKSEDYVKSLM